MTPRGFLSNDHTITICDNLVLKETNDTRIKSMFLKIHFTK